MRDVIRNGGAMSTRVWLNRKCACPIAFTSGKKNWQLLLSSPAWLSYRPRWSSCCSSFGEIAMVEEAENVSINFENSSVDLSSWVSRDSLVFIAFYLIFSGRFALQAGRVRERLTLQSFWFSGKITAWSKVMINFTSDRTLFIRCFCDYGCWFCSPITVLHWGRQTNDVAQCWYINSQLCFRWSDCAFILPLIK